MAMEVMHLGSVNEFRFSLNGECPHCKRQCSFMPVDGAHVELAEGKLTSRGVCAMQCQGCRNFILGFVLYDGKTVASMRYEKHYPLGKPNDEVGPDIPVEVASGFQEAIRCQWVNCFVATVLMCRRSLQISCDREQAKGDDLCRQVDSLAKSGTITEPLRKMAHRIRLFGKQGAHGDYSDIDSTITEEDAVDAIAFMRHYLEHVYVLPAKLRPYSK